MSAVATGRRAATARRAACAARCSPIIALIAAFTVAQGTVSLLDLAARHTTTEVEQFDGVRSLVIDDASDVRLTTAPAGAPLELVTKLTEGLRTPSHDAQVHRRRDAPPLVLVRLGVRQLVRGRLRDPRPRRHARARRRLVRRRPRRGPPLVAAGRARRLVRRHRRDRRDRAGAEALHELGRHRGEPRAGRTRSGPRRRPATSSWRSHGRPTASTRSRARATSTSTCPTRSTASRRRRAPAT